MRVALALIAASMSVGCAGTRPAMMEFADERGRWVVEVHAAELELDGWSVAVTEAELSDAFDPPKLYKLVLEITNTSESDPLILEPMEIYLHALRRSLVELGPYETISLAPGETAVMEYAPGARAPVTAYPFVINVTVFGDEELSETRHVTLTLY